MTFYVLVTTYITFCLIVAFLGRNVSIGFWGVLILGVLLTPLTPAILILLFKPKAKKKKQDYLLDDID